MHNPDRIVSHEELRLFEAVTVAEQLELMLRILRDDADMLASKAGDVALLNVMNDSYQDCMGIAMDAAALAAKIDNMLADIRPQIEATKAGLSCRRWLGRLFNLLGFSR